MLWARVVLKVQWATLGKCFEPKTKMSKAELKFSQLLHDSLDKDN